MLELIRKYKTLFSIIFVLSAVGLVVSMFSDHSQRGASASFLGGGTAAKVDGEEIPTRQLVQVYSQRYEQAQQALNGQGAQDKAQREFLEKLIRAQVSPERILEELIQERFLVSTSTRLGIRSSREGVRSLIENNEAFQENGRFDPLLYKQRVRQPGVYEKELGYQNQYLTLLKTFRQSLAVETPTEAAHTQKLMEKRSFESLNVSPSGFPEPKTLSTAEVQKFRESPEWTKASQDYYNRHISEFKSGEKVKASHILIRENEGGLEKITSVRKEIADGKISFEEASKKYSSDKSNSERGGDLGFFEKETMDPAFAQAAFALTKEKNLSEPVKSSFGYHLIKLYDRNPAVQKDLKSVENEIAPKVALEAAKVARARAFVERFASAASRPSDAEIKRLGLQWTKQADWSPLDNSLGSLGSVDMHLSKILTLNKSNPYLSGPLTMGDSLVVLRWTGNQAPKGEAAPENRLEKSEVAFQYFMRNRYEMLEKAGKIKRSASVLSELRKQTGGEN